MRRYTPSSLEGKLARFHRSKVDRVLQGNSPIAGRQFRNQFNLAAFYPALLRLADCPSSFWGVDRCLRIAENIDQWHSRVFHMGVFARSLQCVSDPGTPGDDSRFRKFQQEILAQFFSLLEVLAIPQSRLEVSYFGGALLGGHPDGRDALLKKRHRFPADEVSRDFLKQRGVRSLAVPSIASFFIQPTDGSLVGPRLEVFYDGVELATIMFNCFRLRRGQLDPIHPIGAYGLGIERLVSIIRGKDFLRVIPRYTEGRKIIVRRNPAGRSPLLEREVMHVLYGMETLALLPARLSRAQATQVTRLKGELKWYLLNLGLSFGDIRDLFAFFRRWK